MPNLKAGVADDTDRVVFRARVDGEGAPPELREHVIAAVQNGVSHGLQAADGRARDIVVRFERDCVEVRVRGEEALPAGLLTTFSEWFSGVLRRRQLRQDAAARAIGVSAKTVSRWIHGETEPRFRELLMVWEALGESPFERA